MTLTFKRGEYNSLRDDPSGYEVTFFIIFTKAKYIYAERSTQKREKVKVLIKKRKQNLNLKATNDTPQQYFW